MQMSSSLNGFAYPPPGLKRTCDPFPWRCSVQLLGYCAKRESSRSERATLLLRYRCYVRFKETANQAAILNKCL